MRFFDRLIAAALTANGRGAHAAIQPPLRTGWVPPSNFFHRIRQYPPPKPDLAIWDQVRTGQLDAQEAADLLERMDLAHTQSAKRIRRRLRGGSVQT